MGDNHSTNDSRRNAAESTRPTFGVKSKSAMVLKNMASGNATPNDHMKV